MAKNIELVLKKQTKNNRHTYCETEFFGGVGVGKNFVVTTGVEGDFTVDTVNVLHGTESIKCTAPINTIKRFSTATFARGKDLSLRNCGRVWFYVEDETTIQQIILYAWDTTQVSTYATVSIPRFKTGWNCYNFVKGEFAINNDFDFSNTDMFEFRLDANSTGEASITWDRVEFTESENAKEIITFSFDDCYESVMTKAKPKFDSYGFKFGVGVVPSFIGNPSRLTVADLLTLQNEGFELAAHGYDHTDYATLTLEEIREDIEKTLKWFSDNGLNHPTTLFYPVGSYLTPEREELCYEYFYLCRGTSNTRVYEYYEALPFGIPENLRAYGMSNTLPNLTSVIDGINNKGILNLYGHDITDAGGSPAMAESALDAILLQVSNMDVDILLFSDIVQNYKTFAYLS